MIGKVRLKRPAIVAKGVLFAIVLLPCLKILADEPKSSLDAKSRQFLLTGQEPLEPYVPLRPRTMEDTERLEAIKYFCIGYKYESEQRWADAIAAYRKALEYDPKSMTLYRSAIQACRAARRMKDALALMQQAEELSPNDSEVLNWLGDSMAEQGQFEPAAQYYRRSLASSNLQPRQPEVVMLKFKLGVISEQLRNFPDAANYYRDVVEAMERPGDFNLNDSESQPAFLRNRADTYERFSRVFRQAKQFDDALRVLRLAQATQPHGTRFSLNIAEIYIDQEKYNQALEYLEKYLNEQTPQGSQAYEKLAVVLGKLGRADEVLPRIKAAAERDRFNAGLQVFLGNLYEESGELEKAKAIYLPILKSSPDSRVYRSLARIYQKEDRFSDLVQLVGEGLERALDNRGFIFDSLPEQLSILTSDPDAAQAAIDAARKIYQEDAKQLKFGARLFAAWVARAVSMHDAAIEFYRLAIDLRPQLPRLHRELGVALQLAGQSDEAIVEAQQAIALDPEDPDNQEDLGRIYVTAGRYDKAIEVYEGILKEFGSDAETAQRARYALSNVYYHMGDQAKAEKALEEILEHDPDDAAANNDLGYFWADQGRNLEQAEKMIRKALERYSVERRPWQPEKNAAYLDSMGWVLFKVGRYEEARKYLEEAVAEKEGSEDGTIVDHLGDVYLRLKDPVKAKELWLRAKQILESADPLRREEQKIKEIDEKLKTLEDTQKNKGETKRER
jgi:tetratricopeptide (TPR) repeat protein